jgi:erythromycin esterase-like protein
MGRGTFADNSRRPRPVAEPPAGSVELVFRAAGHGVAFLRLGDPRVRAWADAAHPYVRGEAVQRIRPGHEFDALVCVDSVSVARYVPP